ncbi:asparagine synthase (glutamine-hydrolyzing) [Curvivirga aplysinae]|uniref:asparagine synthase (glutamine-hydrolyzing) n=1 Tax=Curvivirga aplysinae TaxID=2529852 RepID=UPI0012BCC4E0|nr:asparagine synthase (glutamine-hydrolyzing) [Curvivirga aplysinae]MTI11407.1 asparagine synthase (glutamine-hydrolyzing) [Curvivirga aplysinae]
MCGITGFIDTRSGHRVQELEKIALKMGEAISYRGPDAAQAWADAEHGIAFAHRRLSIIDLSHAGNQPMESHCGRYMMVYNGEVYNAEDLRQELDAKEPKQYQGHSDSEVILEGVATWGFRATIEKLIGMFTIVIWDRKAKTLSIVRDRLGIKPLYWGLQDGRLYFASEMKAIYAHPKWHGEKNRDALAAFLRHNYVPGPYTVFDSIHKLQPGHILEIDGALKNSPKLYPYWSLENVIRNGHATPYQGSDEDLVNQLEELLSDAVKRRMVADVPLGAFLSGGIDSSTVVALMQKQSDRPIKTFSIGFNEEGYNEAKHAAVVAKHLGTEHTELYVSPEEARDVIPKLAHMYDEPFADSSQIPTYLVSAMTKEHVTVALSGDGGDELFAGYNRYFQSLKIGGTISRLPMFARRGASGLIKSFSPGFWDGVFNLVPKSKRPPQAGDKMHKLATVLCEDEDGFYRRLISHWMNPEEIIPGSTEPKGIIWDEKVKELAPDFVERMRYLDICTYLPDDILTKVDRASMAVSLEARVPILDHRVAEFAWTLPTNRLIKNGVGKWPLRQVLYRHVPQEIIDRPKMGFGVPIDSWLRGPLKEWAEDLLNPAMIKKHGILTPDPIWQKWQEHLSGERNWQYYLWDILMLQAWCEEYQN